VRFSYPQASYPAPDLNLPVLSKRGLEAIGVTKVLGWAIGSPSTEGTRRTAPEMPLP
jgi:hypothetical protein